MKKKKVRMMLRGLAESTALAAMVVGTLAGAVRIRAAGADAELQHEYIAYCEEAGEEYSICPELLMAIMEIESGGNPDAVGELGEIGLMQIYPKYHMGRAQELGVYNLFNPEGNIRVAADYLTELFMEYGDMGTVLMKYNGTENAVERGEKGDYTEYAKRIIKRTEQLERQHKK